MKFNDSSKNPTPVLIFSVEDRSKLFGEKGIISQSLAITPTDPTNNMMSRSDGTNFKIGSQRPLFPTCPLNRLQISDSLSTIA